MTQSGGIARVVGLLVGAVFLVFWSSLTLAFDCFCVDAAVKQARAAHYPTTRGTVIRSRVEESNDGEDGTTHKLDLAYAYEVGGRRYVGTRYGYVTSSAVGQGNARREAAAHPAGSAVLVYYRPGHPDEAILRPGLGGGELFLSLILAPFNLVTLGLWSAGAWLLARPVRLRRPGGVRVTYRDYQLRVRLKETRPLAAAGAAAGFVSFVSVFVLAFSTGAEPSAAQVAAAWAVVIALAGAVYLKLALPVWAGAADLVIDPMARTLTLPRTFGRRESISVPFDGAWVDVERRTNSDSERGATHEYLPTVCWPDEGVTPLSAVLAKWQDQGRAERFAAWLRERIGAAPAAGTTNPGFA